MPVLSLRADRDLSGGIRDRNFEVFLDICFEYSDAVSFSKINLSGYEEYKSVTELMLEPHLIKWLRADKWYGYPRLNGSMTQFIYSADSETKKILLDCYSDIFLKDAAKWKRYKPLWNVNKHAALLEDMCFWNRGKMLLGTVSHEFICSTNDIGDDFSMRLLKIASWELSDKPDCGIDKISY